MYAAWMQCGRCSASPGRCLSKAARSPVEAPYDRRRQSTAVGAPTGCASPQWGVVGAREQAAPSGAGSVSLPAGPQLLIEFSAARRGHCMLPRRGPMAPRPCQRGFRAFNAWNGARLARTPSHGLLWNAARTVSTAMAKLTFSSRARRVTMPTRRPSSSSRSERRVTRTSTPFGKTKAVVSRSVG
jgi:hypothetical protein